MASTRQSPVGRLRFRAPVAAALVAATSAGAGVWLLAGTARDLSRRHVVVSGVPLDEVHPPAAPTSERRAGVVVAHGFAGSARLMTQFGDTLSARGYVVVLLDFSGHGANTRPLPDGTASTDASTTALQRDLAPGGAGAAGRRVDPGLVQVLPHGAGRDVMAQPNQFAVDAAVSPRGLSAARRRITQVAVGSFARFAPCTPLRPSRCTRPTP